MGGATVLVGGQSMTGDGEGFGDGFGYGKNPLRSVVKIRRLILAPVAGLNGAGWSRPPCRAAKTTGLAVGAGEGRKSAAKRFSITVAASQICPVVSKALTWPLKAGISKVVW